MNAPETRALRQLSKLQGIQLSYLDMAGQEQEASPETLLAVLSALGSPVETGSDVAEALASEQSRRWQRTVEPVIVAWDGKPTAIPARTPASARASSVTFRLILEDGQEMDLRPAKGGQASSKTMTVRGTSYLEQSVLLPAMPIGYHRLEVQSAGGAFQSLIISAPTRSYAHPGKTKEWGVFLPLYAAHSGQSWGAGNFGDWQRLSDWAGSLGASVVATLPLLAAFLDCPTCEPSPYSPASRLFWNEFYLDITAVPEFAACTDAQKLVDSAAFQRQLHEYRRRREIDYQSQMRARRAVLELLAKCLFSSRSSRRQAFQQFLKERPQAEDYARFRAACEQAQGSWHTWPERQRSGRLNREDYAEETKQYHAYVQWVAQEQMQNLVAHCRNRGVRFYLDLPLGVHPDGYDVWREQAVFALEASAGAPPDPFFSKGQNWGFAPLHPRQVRADGYRHVLEYLRFQMRHTGLLRIDHVMGLHRLYWIPKGLAAHQGAYVSYPADELHALLCLESHRHQTTLVGENLGTVPPAVNASMKRHRLQQMYVLQYEQHPDPRQPLRPPPARCVASVNTHDMPTFAAHWKGKDITDRNDLGLIPKGKLGQERQQRGKLNAALISFLEREGCLDHKKSSAASVLAACLTWLSRSCAERVLINLEDLWLEEAPQNTPGTFRERPNWRRKAKYTLEQLAELKEILEILRELDRLRKR